MENYSEYLVVDLKETSCSVKVMTDLQIAECDDKVIRWANNTFEVKIAAAVRRNNHEDVVNVNLCWVALSATNSEVADRIRAFVVEEAGNLLGQ